MFSIIPDIDLPWMEARYPVTFLNYLFYYSMFKSMPYRIPMWKKFKPKWELMLEEEEY